MLPITPPRKTLTATDERDGQASAPTPDQAMKNDGRGRFGFSGGAWSDAVARGAIRPRARRVPIDGRTDDFAGRDRSSGADGEALAEPAA